MNLYISDNNLVYLKHETLDNYFYSKLCFSDDNFEKASNITINEADCFEYNKSLNEFCFPYDVTEAQRCFLLRLVVDAVQIKRGNLPLHASAVTNGTETYIICAGSGKGKTYISEEVCRKFHSFNIIGDDHIILSTDYIQGNKKRRIRNMDLKETGYQNNIGFTKMTEVSFICFDYSASGNTISYVEDSKLKNCFLLVSAFKYLNEVFVHNGLEYSACNLIESDVNELYEKRVLKYLNNKKAVYIQGTQQYAIDYISNQIGKGE